MTAETTLNTIRKYCKLRSGKENIWPGNSARYKWSLGKATDDGTINGVIRKLAHVDMNTSQEIWVVAGSLKILPDGTIERFTGLPKKMRAEIKTLEMLNFKESESV